MTYFVTCNTVDPRWQEYSTHLHTHTHTHTHTINRSTQCDGIHRPYITMKIHKKE